MGVCVGGGRERAAYEVRKFVTMQPCSILACDLTGVEMVSLGFRDDEG